MDIIFQKLISTPDGVGATSGRYTAKYFDENFDLVKTHLDTLFNIAAVQVSSSNITQLKVDTSTTPYSLYYTLDPLTATNPSWRQIVTDFANLAGTPTDNIALAALFDSKASKVKVEEMDIAVQDHTTKLTADRTDIDALKSLTGEHTSNITGLQEDFNLAVQTQPGDRFWMRYNPSLAIVEYSTDGVNYKNVLTANITFADINGNPQDNVLLAQYIDGLLSSLFSDYALKSSLLSHTLDLNNPHGVTRAQLGLEKVLDDIGDLKGAIGLSDRVDLSTYLTNVTQGSDLFYISSHYPNPDSIGSFTVVKRLYTGENYLGPDGTTIEFTTNAADLPIYYRLVETLDESSVQVVDISFNQVLYEYLLAN